MRTFFATVLTMAALAASADVEVGGPQMFRRAAGQYNLTIASAGGDFITVWQDTTVNALRATRIGADGSVLDPASFRVTTLATPWTPRSLSAAGAGGEFRVVYESNNGAIYATAVSRDGIAAEPKVVLAGYPTLPQIASSSAGTLVVARGDQAIRIAALDAAGSVVHERSIPASIFDGPQIAPLGDGFIIVWAQVAPKQSMAAIVAAIVTAGGDLVGQPRVVAAQGWTPSVASVGDRALITWRRFIGSSENPDGLATAVYGRVVTADAMSDELTIATGNDAIFGAVSLAAHNGRFAVVWMQKTGEFPAWRQEAPPWWPEYDLYGAAVSTNGTVLGSGLVVHGDASAANPVIVSNGQRLLVSWLDCPLPPGPGRIAAGLLTDITAPVEHLDVALSASNQENPRLAAIGDVNLVAWTEDPSNGDSPGVYVRRFDSAGHFLDGVPRAWSDGGNVQDSPSIAVTQFGFGIAWSDGQNRMLARRLRIDGLAIDSTPLNLGDGQLMTPAIASDGESLAALTIEGGMLSAAIVRGSGTIEHHALTPYSAQGFSPVALAWDGTRYVAAFPLLTQTSTANGIVPRQQVNIVAFSSDGRLLSGPSAVTSGIEDHYQPSIACRSGSCLLAWSGWSAIGVALLAGPDRVTQLDMLTPAHASFPQVASAPDGYHVTWTEYDDGAATSLHLRPVSANGVATAAESIVARFDGGASFDATTTANGAVVIAYSKVLEGIAYGGAKRVLVRAGGPVRRRAAGR